MLPLQGSGGVGAVTRGDAALCPWLLHRAPSGLTEQLSKHVLRTNARRRLMTFKSLFRTPALLIVLATLIYVGSASSPSLQDDADAAHAEAAREIVERG